LGRIYNDFRLDCSDALEEILSLSILFGIPQLRRETIRASILLQIRVEALG
jgi:hypothetical protein